MRKNTHPTTPNTPPPHPYPRLGKPPASQSSSCQPGCLHILGHRFSSRVVSVLLPFRPRCFFMFFIWNFMIAFCMNFRSGFELILNQRIILIPVYSFWHKKPKKTIKKYLFLYLFPQKGTLTLTPGMGRGGDHLGPPKSQKITKI